MRVPTLSPPAYRRITLFALLARCARELARRRCDFALNLGLCGSFDPSLRPGDVVHVVRDRIAELGAEDDEAFLTMADIGLPADAVFVNAHPPANAALRGLREADGITVNTVHGCDRSIAAVVARFQPQNPRRVIVATHYDSIVKAYRDPKEPDAPMPGANNSASGVAVLLETARRYLAS